MRLPLTDAVFKVGRHPANDVALPDDEISRSHAVFERRDDGYWVVDQSRNGTFLNGKRVKNALLKNRDELRIGTWRVVFEEDASWAEKETLLTRRPKTVTTFWGMVGKSAAMRSVFSMIDQAEVVFLDEQETRARVEGARRFVEAAVDLLARDHGLRDL